MLPYISSKAIAQKFLKSNIDSNIDVHCTYVLPMYFTIIVMCIQRQKRKNTV